MYQNIPKPCTSQVNVRSWFRPARTTPLGETDRISELNRMHENVQYRVDDSEYVKYISPAGGQAARSCWNVVHNNSRSNMF